MMQMINYLEELHDVALGQGQHGLCALAQSSTKYAKERTTFVAWLDEMSSQAGMRRVYWGLLEPRHSPRSVWLSKIRDWVAEHAEPEERLPTLLQLEAILGMRLNPHRVKAEAERWLNRLFWSMLGFTAVAVVTAAAVRP